MHWPAHRTYGILRAQLNSYLGLTHIPSSIFVLDKDTFFGDICENYLLYYCTVYVVLVMALCYAQSIKKLAPQKDVKKRQFAFGHPALWNL